MKYTWLLFLLIFAPWRANCSRILIGYFSDKVSIWRFWERGKDGQPEAKMIVYNVTDTAIKFSLRKCFQRAIRTKPVQRPADGSYQPKRGHDVNMMGGSYEMAYSDTIVNEAKIPPHSYQVYKLVPSGSEIIYDAALVNGEFAGICEDLEEVRALPANHRYYSNEGLQGSPSRTYVIAKDRLVGKAKKDYILLYSTKTTTREATRTVMTENVTGVEELSICAGDGKCYKREAKSSSMNFSVDFDGASGATINLSCVVADKRKQAMLEIGEKASNQTDGNSWLPIFVK